MKDRLEVCVWRGLKFCASPGLTYRESRAAIWLRGFLVGVTGTV